MIKEFVDKWYLIKSNLAEEIRTTNQSEYDSYEQLLKMTLKHINTTIGIGYKIDSEDLAVIDFGNYQGTKIIAFHVDTYQPYLSDTYYTSVEYGSCSGCDTLLRISNFTYGLPTEQQVQEYLILCLHMVQRIKRFGEEKDD